MADQESAPRMNPMDMMKKMMGDEGGGMPMEICMNMCTRMTRSIEQTSELAAYATPELRGLFETWLAEVEQEAMKFLTENGSVTAPDLAAQLGISPESAVFIIARLAKSDRVEACARLTDNS